MFTVCPKCTLTLAVTANDLRLGQGYVRCGRCSNVFNSLLKLSDVPDESAASAPSIPEVDPATTSQITRALSGSNPMSASTSRPAPSPTPSPEPARTIARPPSPASAPSPTSPAHVRSAATAAPIPSPAPPPPPVPARLPKQPSGAAAPARTAGASPSPGPAPAHPAAAEVSTDADALEQFETVLKTLGLGLDEEVVFDVHPDSPLPHASGSASRTAAERSPLERSLADTRIGQQPAASTTIENIVLEGEEITQSAQSVPEPPPDDLDLFARRLSLAAAGRPASGETDASLRPPRAPPSAPAAPRTPAAPDAVESGGKRGAVAAALAPRFARRAAARSRLAGGSTHPSPVPAAPAVPHAHRPDELQAAVAEAQVSAAHGSLDLDIPGLRPMPASRRMIWIAGSALLLLLLAGQAVDHWRAALATSPTFGPPLMRLYAALGRPIRPQWDLDAYEVRQQGADSEGNGAQIIRVRFSLANHALRAQPVPVLRLTLLDRYGKRIGQRDLSPADYWPAGHPPAAYLASDQRIDSSVQVRDPNADSASFELDVCLPEGPHAIRWQASRTGLSVFSVGVSARR